MQREDEVAAQLEEDKKFLFIHKISPAMAAKKLKKCHKDMPWLLRESTKQGCLTISIRQKDGDYAHIRYGYTNKSWINVSRDEEYEKHQSIIEPKELKQDGIMDAVSDLIIELKKYGFDINDSSRFIMPTVIEATNNDIYSTYIRANAAYLKVKEGEDLSKDDNAIIERVKEKLESFVDDCCPISAEDLGGLPVHAFTENNPKKLYDPNALQKWLALKGTDPMTRANVAPDEVGQTTFFSRTWQKLKRIEVCKNLKEEEKKENSSNEPYTFN